MDQGGLGRKGGVTVSLCSSSSFMAEGSLATGFLCGKQVARLIPFSVPCMGWSRPLALTRCPSCCEGGRFPEDTWVWRFPSSKNLYGVEPPHALSLDPYAFAGNRDGIAWLCRNQTGSKNRALCMPRTGYHLLNRVLPRLRTTLSPLPASPMCWLTQSPANLPGVLALLRDYRRHMGRRGCSGLWTHSASGGERKHVGPASGKQMGASRSRADSKSPWQTH